MLRHTQKSFWVRSRSLLLALVGFSVLVLITACLASGQSLEESTGMASYYGSRFAGETTANGETFDPNDMTAAHPSLPFDTVVRVIRIGGERRRSVTVRINDRGPFADDRIIDLSRAAAEEIGMIDEGVVEVRVEVLELPEGVETADSHGSGKGW